MNLLDLIFPKRCLECGRIGKYFCDRCSSKIRFIVTRETICPICARSAIDGRTHPYCQTSYTLDGLTSFFHYDVIIRKAVKAIKYRFVSDLAKEFIGLIPRSSLNQVTNLPTNQDTIVIPVPLHPSRLRFRGFNQAELLGSLIAKKLNVPTNTGILKRVRSTIPQVEMKDRNKRLVNMEKAFSIQPLTINHKPLTISLFDDVFTTGATMRSAASVLKRAGVNNIWGITIAR